MPQVSTIPMVRAQDDDTPILCFRGVCKSFGKYYPADNTTEPKKQSMQIATFTDGKESITVKFFNRDAIPQAWKGKTVWIEASHNKNGWTGVKAKDNTYKDEVERIILVTKSANVGLTPAGTEGQDGGGEDSEPANEGTSAPAREPASDPAPASHGGDPGSERKAVSIMRRELSKYANAFLLVVQSADWVRSRLEDAQNPIEVTDAQFQAMCSTFFIKADRQGLIDGLPVRSVLGEEFAKRTTHTTNGSDADAKAAAAKAAAEAKALAEANAKAEEEARKKAEAAAKAAKAATEVAEDDVPF